jgi:hypothetical protein
MKSGKTILIAGMVAGIAATMIIRRFRSATNMQGRADDQFTDLNSATTEDFARIGLNGDVITRIIDNRPYRNKLELVSRMIIPAAVYGDIRHAVGVTAETESVKVA